MERYKSFCKNCNERPITYENEWADGPPKCLRCHEPLANRTLFPFVARPQKIGADGMTQRERRKKKHAIQKNGYDCRRDALTVMGFRNYREYLKSPLWREIRDRVRVRDNYTCQSCGGRGNEVHHNSYSLEVLEGRALSQLVLLCDECHGLIEFDGRDKCTFYEAHQRCDALLKATSLPGKARKRGMGKRGKKRRLR